MKWLGVGMMMGDPASDWGWCRCSTGMDGERKRWEPKWGIGHEIFDQETWAVARPTVQ